MQHRRRFLFLLVSIALVFMLRPFAAPVYAAGVLSLDVNIVDSPTQVQTGEIIEYVIDFSCGGTVGGCGDLVITAPIDPNLELIEIVTSTGYSGTVQPGPTVQIVDNDNGGVDAFADGDASQVIVRARVRYDLLGGETIPFNVTGTISDPNTPGDATVADAAPIVPVATPSEQWDVQKTQTAPAGGIAPSAGGDATYSVELCSLSATGNISLNNVRLVDTFPTGATVVGNPDGGTVIGNTIEWNLGTVDIATVQGGCVSVSYTLNFPAGTFPVNTPYTNSVEAFGDNPNFNTDGPCGTNCVGDTSTNDTIDPPTANPIPSKDGPGTTFISTLNTSNSVFRLGMNLDQANVPVEDLILRDTFPKAISTPTLPAIDVINVTSGSWSGGILASVEFSTDDGVSWTPFGPAIDGSAVQTYPRPALAPGVYITDVRWVFDPAGEPGFVAPSDVPPGFGFNTNPTIRFEPNPDLVSPTDFSGSGTINGTDYRDYDNCANISYAVDGGATQTTADACANARITEDPAGFANILWDKTANPSEIDVEQDIRFTLDVAITQEASGNLIDPALEDILPAGLDFVSWDNITFTGVPAGEQVNPFLFRETVVVGTDTRERVLFYWGPSSVAGSVDFAGAAVTAGTSNTASFTPPATGTRTITIEFTARSRLDTAAGNYSNDVSITSNSPNLFCQSGTTTTDVNDIDGDGVTGEIVCETNAGYLVREAAELRSQKWIRSTGPVTTFVDPDDPTATTTPSYCPIFNNGGNDYTRFPCVAQGTASDPFEYLMRMSNTGLVPIDNYIMYDVNPYINDVGVSQALATTTRDTEFLIRLTGPVTLDTVNSTIDSVATTFLVEYSTSGNEACRTEMSSSAIDETSDWQATLTAPNPPWTGAPCVDDWTATPADFTTVTAFRITQTGGTINPGEEMLWTVPGTIIPYDEDGNNIITPEDPETGEVSWNSFAQRFDNEPSGARLLTAEPRKVGIVIFQEFSIGNIVWEDNGVGGGIADDGIINGTEAGLANITMQLFRDANGNNSFQPAVDTLINTDITDANGYYLFESDSGGNRLTPGTYFIRIDPNEFDTGDLVEYVGSTPRFNNENVDNNDNGINPGAGGGNGVGDPDLLPTQGIFIRRVQIDVNGEPTGEIDVSNNAADGPAFRGNRFQEDEDSNLTIDFGLYKPHSIGNRVWLDDGAGTPANENNGLIDAGEVGIDGVDINLYGDTDNDGVVEVTGDDSTPVATTTTANGGYYLFDLLRPGLYVVQVAPSSFAFGANPSQDGPLSRYITSTGNTGDTETDNDDNGIDPPGADEGIQRTDGIFSELITLEYDGETTAEAAADKDTTLTEPDGRRTDFDSSELTVDFGFYEETTLFSLGNRVWFDDDNNGIIDTGEAGVPGVTLELYFDDNSDGIPDDNGAPGLADDVLDTVVTDGSGYYRFDNLDPGRYVVHMIPDNWTAGAQPLDLYFSSTTTTTTENTDNNDNGVDETDYPTLITTGVFSNTVQLVPQGEPITENTTDPGNPGRGTGVEDNNSDLTVDFGVYRRMSLGNFVWIDSANTNGALPGDGIFQPGEGEAGVDGVVVQLFRDVDGDGIAEPGGDDGGIIDTDTTANGGYYLFEDLGAGDYFVRVAASNFNNTGDVLFFHISSDGTDGDNTDDAVDNDDNGEPGTDPTTQGVLSEVITLTKDSETTAEAVANKEVGVLDGQDVTEANSELTIDFGFYVPPLSIGNRVWLDADGDGLLEPGAPNNEVGIDNITMLLFEDVDDDGVFEPGGDDGAAVATNVTRDGGYYIFANLPPGNYFVQVDPNEFDTGDLVNFISTQTAAPLDETTNYDDNGIDQATTADYIANGVVSNRITLTPDTQPQVTDEPVDDFNPGGADEGASGRGPNLEEDDDSNLSVDFGFYEPVALGNRVWLDEGAGGNNNNGLLDTNEVGINGVTLNLYADTDRDGIVEPLGDDSTPFRTTTTVSNAGGDPGFYIFDGLPEGIYIVGIPASNFAGPLNGFVSSTGADTADNEVDGNDNGIDDADPATNGIFGPQISVTLGGETPGADPANNDGLGDEGDGSNSEGDDDSDLTMDFGFTREPVSIGNRIWYDADGDGLLEPGGDDGATPGIDGVTVFLFEDVDNDGVFEPGGDDGAAIGTNITHDGGFYIFENLLPGNYFVQIDPTEFAAGGDLVNHISTLTGPLDETTNLDDNGNDQADDTAYIANGVVSNRITLTPNTMPETSDEVAIDINLGGTDEGANGRGVNVDEDRDSNLSVDFGFYQPMAIGNRVWIDNGPGGNNNNGLLDTNEVGRNGVVLNLYRDTDGDGTVEPLTDDSAVFRTTTTAANGGDDGFYIFDGLPPGEYIVQVAPGNFATGLPLDSLESSTVTSATDNDTDGNDDGIDDAAPGTNGIFSTQISLVFGGETEAGDPANNDGLGVEGDGTNGERDADSNLTVDFGFTTMPMSLGNRVWYDADFDGTINGAEVGLDNVTVFLFEDIDNDGVFEPGGDDGTALQTDVTHDGGFYIFDNLLPGNYFVQVDPAEFDTGGDLVQFVSTVTGTPNPPIDDSNDNGNDPATRADYIANGVVSDVIALVIGAEPTGEAANNNGSGDEGPLGRGLNGEEDADSDLTIDFGFYVPMALGNRVWLDDGGTGSGVYNNGIQDGDEAGIENVTVNLYFDNDGDGTVEPNGDDGGPVDTTTTDANGYYIFDGLREGPYIVEIPTGSFATGQPLFQLFSSFIGGAEADNGTEQTDIGIDEANPSTNGIRSPQITLALNTEPNPAGATDDTDLGPDGDGSNNELDDNGDLTVDFGFLSPPMSIGNRLWFDPNNNGEIDTGETFVPNAIVDLYRDTNGNGTPDAGEFLTTTNTDANGYYLFDNLSLGDYIVVINEDNFRTGGVLQDFVSTQNATGPVDDDTDTTPGTINGVNTDDGIDTLTPEVSGIQSAVITLTPEAEITTEADLGPDGDGTNGETVTNSNLTVDFGFYKPMSIGNRVWFDADNDGLISTGETGAATVMVSLFVDENNDGLPDDIGNIGDPSDDVVTEMTDANGYYLFDNLTPGNYRVRVEGVNFDVSGPLQGTTSTVTGVANPTVQGDNNDNGIDQPDEASYIANGVISDLITLTTDTEPTAESDFSGNTALDGANSIGVNGETDNNSDISIDFGFSAPTQMSVGNRVWIDLNRDGLIDAGENGVANVEVGLYRDANGDGTPDSATPVDTTTTDANGYYLFEGVVPGRYVVALDAANFNAGGVLEGYGSTTTGVDNTTPPEDTYTADRDDNNDNGIDTVDATFGILSNTVDLVLNNERDDETDLGALGDGTGITAANSDLTVDFGVFRPLSIGNRVWFDSDDSGTINGTESGAANVFVTLFDDANGNGIPDAGEEVSTEQTDTNGYYLFDNLTPGDYIVRVDPVNFTGGGPLEGTASSTGVGNNLTVDNNDNGDDGTVPGTDGVWSTTVTLTLDGEPTGETDLSGNTALDGPDSRGTNGESDNNSNLTIDFGFVPSDVFSIGNRVWLDVDGDGLIGGSEVGIPGVSVSLYRDANNDGEPDGAAISTESTDANGYYLFDGLTQGNYLVGVDASNFDPGGPLEGRASTLSAVDDNPADAIPPEDVDSNDNRTTPARLDMINTTYGFVSDTIALTVGGEPTGETDLSGNTALDGPNSIGNSGETDANSNITVDFGFYQSIAIGNRVWFDPNDNGIIDTGEQGISGVDVTLYRDSNSDGVPDDIDGNGTFGDAGDGLQTDTTDSNGYYLFNNVSPGNYIVGVDGSNFNAGNVLSGSASSSGSAVTAVDSNDNGIDTADGQGNILSNTIVVTANNTPSGETDTSGDIADGPNFRGINNESDNNSDITIDFGFVANPMSIGNRVWLDDGSGGGTSNNGQIDGGEQGISGVTMQLFADADGDGQPDSGIPVATDTTDANGYYLFDGIPPGRYVVQVAPLNFIGGGALDGVFSSAGNGPAGTSSRDQGIDDNDPSANGILSGSILLEQNNAPTTADEDDLSGNAADGPDSRGNNGETDNNSDLTVDFGFTAVFDWSDAPDSYGTTSGSDGARHRIISTLFMGDEIDDETDGQPNTGADGDDNNGTSSDDEDGVRIEDFVAGTSTTVEVSVFNDTGQDATLIVWIDWDGDGTFDSGEGSSVTVPPDNSTQAVQVPVTVPLTADVDTGGTTYLRARLTTDNITVNNPTGAADSGEVEDYVVNVLPPGLAISKTDAFNSIVAGQATTYTITINNSGTDALNRQFVDDVPAEYENVTWTCTATNGASCIAGDAAGTGDTGTGDIDTLIDIPRDGQIVFTIDATLNANTTNTTLVNTATVINGPSSTDTNGVIFDPPTGSKIGVVEGDTLIRWTQEWINSGGAAQAATITDDLPSDQTFAGNLVCSAQGTSTTTSCTENNGTITWTGTIFPGNANTVLISFNVTVAGAGTYTNTASLTDGTTVTSASDTVTINQDGTSNNDDDDDGGICCPTATPTPGPTLTPIPGAVQDPFLDVLELPATGEKPWWNMPLLVTLWAIAAAAVLSGVAAVVRRLRHRE